MRQEQTSFGVSSGGATLVEITDEIDNWLRGTGIVTGLVTIFCRHTSASLTINENAAPAVRRDLLRWLDKAVPKGSHYEHDDEGPDDMPAHIKSMLTGNSLTVPVSGGRMALGTWQGIYLVEHRSMSHRRNIVVHIIGE
ncbi:secondary thiamine-phosphate synthase enzyme [Altererythrobacter atlanticus]|uniref:Uncharacterized protein n=1 Tax=Croceibacterium atlanticum TaxID=1267766 RepID=A0A0F7KPU7_9SPHN|nr:secondary thiamine-phosphate synthase enzyme YjbQ [Croceibacterium atlanticum]AKH42553.1 hypothetical protein WYH_01514 [Croceibacterium atlanticum]MBB5731330.1 secondary thiamine-phosphate synthase enzyme [Croceibacterium atlanticum]